MLQPQDTLVVEAKHSDLCRCHVVCNKVILDAHFGMIFGRHDSFHGDIYWKVVLILKMALSGIKYGSSLFKAPYANFRC